MLYKMDLLCDDEISMINIRLDIEEFRLRKSQQLLKKQNRNLILNAE